MNARGPARFGWLLPGQLAGSARPGRLGSLERDLDFLRAEGIHVIVSLLESTTNLEEYRRDGFEAHHFPVADFTAPELDRVAEVCGIIEEALLRGKGVLVHCNAGIGRTGTILACFLVHRGEAPEGAIERVRRERPLSLETAEQAESVYRYHQIRSESRSK